MDRVPANIQVSLEDYVNENKRYFAWLPTEPKYLVICEPTPEPSVDGSSAAPNPGKPQGFLAAFHDKPQESPRTKNARLFSLEFGLSLPTSSNNKPTTPRGPITPRASTPRQ
eukprot:TRINITY_DN1882_c0_g1_i2.p1 TRINITY_DN1882_c0_g1~~TRINITY_DN1882_c0_g1_i2.p1  ORF type:complete len:112 (-),score=9.92 TRINITY_DN1882_c0_g1_i2:169-504(-)